MSQTIFSDIQNLYNQNSLVHFFSTKAMATIFEIYVVHPDKKYALEAASAAFSELDRLEAELSRYIENSEISRINALSLFEKTTVSIDVFNCLQQCHQLYQETKGAFDISTALLIDFWKKQQSSKPYTNYGKDVERLMQYVGIPWLQIDEAAFQVTLMNEAIFIDLGGFGKGYAIDRMILLLREWGIKSGLIHGGRSTVAAFVQKEKDMNWPLSISHPQKTDDIIEKIDLSDRSLSGSGLMKGPHIIDPRTGFPALNNLAAWAIDLSAARSDALSTAFMIMSIEQIEEYCLQHPQSAAIVIENNRQNTLHKIGKW